MKITLCGSGRFLKAFRIADMELTLAGHVVYSMASANSAGWDNAISPLSGPIPDADEEAKDRKLLFDAVHMVKIANSDMILVLNVDGYIGESTLREIYFAMATGKRIEYLDIREGVNRPYQKGGGQLYDVLGTINHTLDGRKS